MFRVRIIETFNVDSEKVKGESRPDERSGNSCAENEQLALPQECDRESTRDPDDQGRSHALAASQFPNRENQAAKYNCR